MIAVGVVIGLVLVVLWVRRRRRLRAPIGRVSIDRYGPERAIFAREVTHRELRRRRYRGK